MNNFFDYIFYRIYKYYQKRDGTPEIYAAGVISILQFFFLLSVLAFTRLFVRFPLPQKYIVIPLILTIIMINWFKYERNFDIKSLEVKWENEEPHLRNRRGWLIFFLLIGLVIFPIVIGVMRNNLAVT